jgi:hypothetical protein
MLIFRVMSKGAFAMSAARRRRRVFHWRHRTDRDTDFIDALCELPAWASGVNVYERGEAEIFEEARRSRLLDLHKPLLDQIEARESVEQEVLMIVNTVRGDLAHDSGLESREFEAIARVVESRVGAPWKMKDGKTICELVNGKAEYHLGSEDEVRDAVDYPNEAAYLASRAA